LTREELFSEILAARPGGNDLVYIERRGEDYGWNRVNLGTDMPAARPNSSTLPDAWIYYSGWWPFENEGIDRWHAFFDDLLAEMESMADGTDRCRWPFDEPWPHGH
jgi:hypothetical protein